MKKVISVISICVLLILQMNLISYAEEGTQPTGNTATNDYYESEEYLNKEIEYSNFVEMEKGTTVKDFIEKEKNSVIERAKKEGLDCTFLYVRVNKINGNTYRDLKAAYENPMKETDIISTNIMIEMHISYSDGNSVGEGKIIAAVVKGDLTGTGEVDVTSLSLMQQEIVEETELKGAYKEAADMNSDKDIDVLDLSTIQEEIVND